MSVKLWTRIRALARVASNAPFIELVADIVGQPHRGSSATPHLRVESAESASRQSATGGAMPYAVAWPKRRGPLVARDARPGCGIGLRNTTRRFSVECSKTSSEMG